MTPAMREGTRLHELIESILDPRVQRTIIAALRHCQGMGHPLPLTEAEIDALCVRLGDQQ